MAQKKPAKSRVTGSGSAGKKVAAKKSVTKKPAPKKVVAKKKPAAKKVTKKTVTKKVTKKPVAKKTAKKKVAAKKAVKSVTKKPVVIEAPAEVRKHVVFVHTCSSCNHVPLGVNALLGVCLFLLIALSTMVVSASGLLPVPELEFGGGSSSPVSIDSVVQR